MNKEQRPFNIIHPKTKRLSADWTVGHSLGIPEGRPVPGMLYWFARRGSDLHLITPFMFELDDEDRDLLRKAIQQVEEEGVSTILYGRSIETRKGRTVVLPFHLCLCKDNGYLDIVEVHNHFPSSTDDYYRELVKQLLTLTIKSGIDIAFDSNKRYNHHIPTPS